MSDYLANFDAWEGIGWLGQGFYFGRFLVQWLASERARQIVVPTIFWWMSLFGAMCTTSFALQKGSLFFMAGPCVNFFIFARNLLLVRTGRPLEGKILVPFAFGLGTVALAVSLGAFDFSDSWPWLLVGGLGTVLWTIRFPLQWWISERRAEATLPRSFFQVSFAGSVLLLIYACRTGEPIFIAGMALGPFLYARSLMLSYRTAPPDAEAPVTT